jgi:hypothetical protein
LVSWVGVGTARANARLTEKTNHASASLGRAGSAWCSRLR